MVKTEKANRSHQAHSQGYKGGINGPPSKFLNLLKNYIAFFMILLHFQSDKKSFTQTTSSSNVYMYI